jgi:hypothetical protein
MMARKTDPSKTNQQIDENLKRVYDDALQENLPEKFLDLLKRLKDADKARQQDDDDG